VNEKEKNNRTIPDNRFHWALAFTVN